MPKLRVYWMIIIIITQQETQTVTLHHARFTDAMVDMVRRHHSPGHVEICLMTHFEHPYEVTPEAAEAIARLREAGVRFYNQAVFTMENSRRFELAALREILWSVGVDPYYTFNAKGKEETHAYRAPIARILQERKEEARLLPGVSAHG